MAKSPKLPEEVNGFLDEANTTSEPARTSWLAFLALLTYVVVTLASVSHKDLLLNSPVRLPIINADIPLVGFFQYAPAMLLLVYLSLLVQHVILARKYRKFTDALAAYEMKTRTQHLARERVHSYAFSQILAGPEPNRITNHYHAVCYRRKEQFWLRRLRYCRHYRHTAIADECIIR